MMLLRKMLQLFWKTDPNILLEDLFNGSAVNANLWTITDSENKITVSGGNLVFAGGKAAPAWGDPALVSKASWARRAGLTIEWQVTPADASTFLSAGFTDGSLAANAREPHSFEFRQGVMNIEADQVAPIVTPFNYTAASLWCRIVVLATGAYYYVSTDNKVTWYFIWIDVTVTTATLYAFIESFDAALTASGVDVSMGSVIGALLSASPGAPTLTPGVEKISNGGFDSATTGWSPLNASLASVAGGQSGNCLEITKTTPGSASNAAQTPTLVAGTWYLISGYVKSGTQGDTTVALGLVNNAESAWVAQITGTSSGSWAQLLRAGRATETNNKLRLEQTGAGAGTMLFDTVSLTPLPFDTTGVLTYIGDSGRKLGIAKANITVGAGYQAGFVICADSATAPTNCLYVYYDRTAGKAYLMKVTAGSPAELIASTVAYGAASEARIVITGPVTAARVGLYYGTVGAPPIQSTIQGPYDLTNYGTHVFSLQTSAAELVQNFEFHGGIGV